MAKLRNQLNSTVGRVLLSAVGVIAAGAIGGGVAVHEFNSDGGVSTKTYVAHDELNIQFTQTGGSVSDVAKYDAVLVKNPMDAMEQVPSDGTSQTGAIVGGSGTIIRLTYENYKNPEGATFDCCFVASANAGTGAALGTCILDNTGTATGALASYTTGTAVWPGDSYLMCSTLTTIAEDSLFDARLRLEWEDRFGE